MTDFKDFLLKGRYAQVVKYGIPSHESPNFTQNDMTSKVAKLSLVPIREGYQDADQVYSYYYLHDNTKRENVYLYPDNKIRLSNGINGTLKYINNIPTIQWCTPSGRLQPRNCYLWYKIAELTATDLEKQGIDESIVVDLPKDIQELISSTPDDDMISDYHGPLTSGYGLPFSLACDQNHHITKIYGKYSPYSHETKNLGVNNLGIVCTNGQNKKFDVVDYNARTQTNYKQSPNSIDFDPFVNQKGFSKVISRYNSVNGRNYASMGIDGKDIPYVKNEFGNTKEFSCPEGTVLNRIDGGYKFGDNYGYLAGVKWFCGKPYVEPTAAPTNTTTSPTNTTTPPANTTIPTSSPTTSSPTTSYDKKAIIIGSSVAGGVTLIIIIAIIIKFVVLK